MPDGSGNREGTKASAYESRLRFAAVGALVFAAVVVFGLIHHEMWRDELQAWMLVHDSATVGEMFQHLRYEGHPPTWYLLLFPLTRLTADPAAMQVVSFAIAVACAWLILRFAPFPRWQRALLVASYFIAYEYAVISRSYGLGALAMFATCALFPVRRRTYLPLALSLALLASTSAYGVLVAFGLAAGLGVEALVGRSRGVDWPRGRYLWLAAAVVFATACASVLLIVPPRPTSPIAGPRPASPSLPGGGTPVKLSIAWQLAYSVSTIWSGYVPIPAFIGDPWEQSRILLGGSTAGLAAAASLSALFFLVLALSFARRPAALVCYVLGTAAVVAFSWFFPGQIRHQGHVFLILIAALWLWHSTGAWLTPGVLARPISLAERVRPALLAAILVTQATATAFLYWADARLPFSTAREMARAASAFDPNRFVVTVQSTHALGVAAFLGRPVYVPEVGRSTTFLDQSWPRKRLDGAAEALEETRPILREREGVLLVSPDSSLAAVPGWHIEPVQPFRKGVAVTEDFSLWLARPAAR